MTGTGTGNVVAETAVNKLEPGRKFRIHYEHQPPQDGMLVSCNLSSATVMLAKPRRSHSFTTGTGRAVAFNEGGMELTHISPSTPVERLAERVDLRHFNEEDDQMVALPGINQNGKKKLKVVAKAKKAAKVLNDCLCGCGSKVANRFKMGHDGRYYGALRKLVAGKIKVGEAPEGIRSVADAKAALKAANH